jgi:hypothetical protein
MDAREMIAKQIGMLALTNAEQAARIAQLEAELAALRPKPQDFGLDDSLTAQQTP